MNRKNTLIIFVKNTVKGKVKTRLAEDIGNEKALDIYEHLLKHTCDISSKLKITKQVWYSDFIENRDIWEGSEFEKFLQNGDNLGDRMKFAVEKAFSSNVPKVVIIGSDCAEITENHIHSALKLLDDNDVVIGPSEDGGYYLLGLKYFVPDLFEGIDWSTSRVADQTREVLRNRNLKWEELEKLNDIDTIDDLKSSNSLEF